METPPKLLVLSSSLPGTRHGAGVVQDEILRRYPRDRYACFALSPPEWEQGSAEVSESLRGVPFQVGALIPQPRFRGARFYLPMLRFLGYRLLTPLLVKRAVAFGRRHGVELVWAELQGESLLLAARVAQGLGVPLVGTIWDDPDGWLADSLYDPPSSRLLLRRFQESLRLARRVSTVSEAMQEDYRKRFGLESTILRYGHDLQDGVPTPVRRHPGGVVVGFAGSIYGEDAWRAFLKALARLNTGGQLPPIQVEIFGGERFPYPHPGVVVRCRGWLPQREMLQALAATDFCYLPYWFRPDKRRHAELSFPTKVTTYMAAGRPVLGHGPAAAVIHRIIQQWGVGLSVLSLAEEELVSSITRLVQDISLKKTLCRASFTAFQQEFNTQVMMENFGKLIGLNTNL